MDCGQGMTQGGMTRDILLTLRKIWGFYLTQVLLSVSKMYQVIPGVQWEEEHGVSKKVTNPESSPVLSP